MSVYIVDDHPLMRQAFGMLMRRVRPRSQVIELAKPWDLYSAIIKNGPPELLVIDLLLPGTKGTETLTDLRARYPAVPIVVISAVPASTAKQSCLQAGADIYLEKTMPPSEMLIIIQILLKSNSDDIACAAAEVKLTKRQKQLILLLDQGLTNNEIAETLHISEHTVKVHMSRLFRRIGVNSRTQTLHYARRHGLLSF